MCMECVIAVVASLGGAAYTGKYAVTRIRAAKAKRAAKESDPKPECSEPQKDK